MKPHYKCSNVTVLHGNNLYVLRTLSRNSFDAIVTDPPYALSFMGKDWDKSHPDPVTWQHCWRVLKPGGYLLSFGGTRTWHRLACDIEDAGFEIRDSIAWLYGSGFPKSLDVSKAIDKAAGAEREVTGRAHSARNGNGQNVDYGGYGSAIDGTYSTTAAPASDAARQWQGWGTALKPAFEPTIVARKPLRGTVADNVQWYGTGALNIDECRVPHGNDVDLNKVQRQQQVSNETSIIKMRDCLIGKDIQMYKPGGRWPTNAVLDDTQVAELDAQNGIQKDGVAVNRNRDKRKDGNDHGYGGEPGASRFFPTFRYQSKAPNTQRPNRYGVAHPTVKPLDLMRRLVRLVTPPGGLVLYPFAGSGTTAEACIDEDMRCVVIEIGEDYLPHIVQRIERANTAARQRKRREQRKKRGTT